MLELLMNGELHLSRAWKLGTAIVPFFACGALVLFVKYARWNEKRKTVGMMILAAKTLDAGLLFS